MSNTPSGSPASKSEVEIYVFLGEYGFRVEPGFAVASRGDVLVIWNYTASRVVLTFAPEIRATPLPVDPGKPERVILGTDLKRSFYPYSASVDIGGGQEIEALGGSGPGVIIRP
jgi:hypothetical protein